MSSIQPNHFVRHDSHPNAEGLVVSTTATHAKVQWPDSLEEYPVGELQPSEREPLAPTKMGRSTP